MPIYDALYDYKNTLRHILVRHEQGAAHAAEGYARLKGKPGLCMATSGPGATNLITGIADAMCDSVPIVCITGQVAAAHLGTDAFQEAPIIGMVTPVTKWCYQITKTSEVPSIVAKAFAIAKSGRPGPVLIDITKNAQTDFFDFDEQETIKTNVSWSKKILSPQATDIDQAAKLLNNAKRPFLLIGHGISIGKAEEALMQVAEKGNFPTASTLLGLSSMPTTHPLYMGMLGMHGNYSTNKLTNKADVIFAIGMRFDDRVTGTINTYAKQAKIIHVDIDKAELNKVIPATLGIHADAKEFLEALLPLLTPGNHAEWIEEFRMLERQEKEQVQDAELFPEGKDITMAEVVRMLSNKTKGTAAIVADVGQHQMIAARYYEFERPDGYITSGGLGTMGFALPAAIGAKIADPAREVIAIAGDGSFQMNIQELGTIMQEKLPVKIIILNNEHLGMVRQWQELFFDKRYSAVDMKNPDFIKIAEGYGIAGEVVTEREALGGALDRLLDSKVCYLLDIRVRKDENVFPMVPSGASIADIRLS